MSWRSHDFSESRALKSLESTDRPEWSQISLAVWRFAPKMPQGVAAHLRLGLDDGRDTQWFFSWVLASPMGNH